MNGISGEDLKMPLLSILIPVYNTDAYIQGTIESVLSQTFTDFELIIVDDHSTDNTYTLCKHYADRDARIKLYRNEVNLGMMANWNHGLTFCKATYFVKLDADDRWHTKMLETCVAILEADEQIGLVFTKYALINEKGEIIDQWERTLPPFARNQSFHATDLVKKGTYGMLQDDVLKQGVAVIRRKVFDELGPFLLHDAGDTEMWFRIGAHYKLHGVDQTYYFYREWADNFTRTQVLRTDKRAKNLFEVRKLIFDYYYGQKLLSKKEYQLFSADNKFEYDKHVAYRFRRDGHIWKSLGVMLANTMNHPFRAFSFYFNRLREKL
ncbi:MAG TPA: glycosyltransferase family 2 protein [Ohtaekwangia sp.]